jgi:adenylosuccinate synthase
MKKQKFNVVTDGQWGSCGKGLIATALAYKHQPNIISTTNMANAGHTAVNDQGDAFIAKAVPSGSAINKWQKEGYQPTIFIGATAAFHLDRIMEEIEECNLQDKILIHERAGFITQQHKETEADNQGGTKHIASTMQGCGAFLADKVMRRKQLKLARDYQQLADFMAQEKLNNSSVPLALAHLLNQGQTILHEGSQGFSLDISHGSHYPQCTSRSTTAVQNLADIGLPASYMGDVYLVIRPYPIRVGNVIENDQVVGHSGGVYSDQHEIDWQQVATKAGAPPEVMQGELTTVTKRLRRVFTFSEQQLKDAVLVNGATQIALNFANYIDWKCFGVNDFSQLPDKVMQFIDNIEQIAQIPVTIVGTGPQNNHVCFK